MINTKRWRKTNKKKSRFCTCSPKIPFWLDFNV
nr:MAG TPA_asm: Synaptonemal complex 2 Spt16M-like domain [Caudoviricetes sp.]